MQLTLTAQLKPISELKSLQVHETDEEDDVYVGLCVGDKLEFIGVWDECI